MLIHRTRTWAVALLAALPFFVSLPEGGAAPKEPSISSAAWQPISPMTSKRRGQVAHFVADKGLVVLGGYAGSGGTDTGLQTAERLDPATGTWSPLSMAPRAISSGLSLTLPDGRIFVVDGDGTSTYDPATDTWASGSAFPMNWEYTGTLGLLPDGDVILAGPVQGEDVTNKSIRYDPATNTVVSSPKLKEFRSGHTGTALPDGRFLVTGGWQWGSDEDGGEIHVTLTSAEIFDPATDTWTLVAPMATSRKGHAAALLPSGKVLVTGGVLEGQGVITSAEIYDPATDTWATVAPLNEARWYHVMTALPSGRVMVSGGRTGGLNYLSSVEIYDPDVDAWVSLPPMASGRLDHTATYAPGHGVFIAGGYDGSTSLSGVELYPLGNAAAGTACVIGDECTSGVCESGQCMNSGNGAGGAGGEGGGGTGGAGGEGGEGAGGAGGEGGGGTGGAGGEGG
ncbi:kelch repeat-containing protein, partial [Polyangium sp. 15x6]|uniref:Kelch repeat-containing protein n=1 Tax=Polyangium sp. 15x6 TaxID=3042687 RepID=UPI002499FCBF